MLLRPYVEGENDLYALIHTLWGTRKSLLPAGLADLYNKTCIMIWNSIDWLNWSFAGSHWQPKEVISDLAEVIRKVTRARLFFEQKRKQFFIFVRTIFNKLEPNHFSSAGFKTWLWIWRLLGMCKDYRCILVQVERNKKLIQNQTTVQTRAKTHRQNVAYWKPAGRSTIT